MHLMVSAGVLLPRARNPSNSQCPCRGPSVQDTLSFFMHIERLFACAFPVRPPSILCPFKPHVRPRLPIAVSGQFMRDSGALSEDTEDSPARICRLGRRTAEITRAGVRHYRLMAVCDGKFDITISAMNSSQSKLFVLLSPLMDSCGLAVTLSP